MAENMLERKMRLVFIVCAYACFVSPFVLFLFFLLFVRIRRVFSTCYARLQFIYERERFSLKKPYVSYMPNESTRLRPSISVRPYTCIHIKRTADVT